MTQTAKFYGSSDDNVEVEGIKVCSGRGWEHMETRCCQHFVGPHNDKCCDSPEGVPVPCDHCGGSGRAMISAKDRG